MARFNVDQARFAVEELDQYDCKAAFESVMAMRAENAHLWARMSYTSTLPDKKKEAIIANPKRALDEVQTRFEHVCLRSPREVAERFR
jgi:hypothetical protein